jgi:hypothetical protein
VVALATSIGVASASSGWRRPLAGGGCVAAARGVAHLVSAWWLFGGRDFNPLAIVFQPLTWPRRFPFYRAFQAFKHGHPEEVERIGVNSWNCWMSSRQ